MIRAKAPRVLQRDARHASAETILTLDALAFLKALHREFEPRRQTLLRARAQRQASIDAGARPEFLPETAHVRASEWQITSAPHDLQRRWVEITGPADRTSVINGLNSGADAFVADFGDSLSPTWPNVVEGHTSLYDALRRNIDFVADDGRPYRLSFNLATLMVRPRGLHLDETHVKIAGQPISASLFDFGLYFFHNAEVLLARVSGPYFDLSKLESRLEARFWNDVFTFAQSYIGIPYGSIRATVLIEHILAAFEMEEILFELKDHAAGLSAGRWNYIFSTVKTFGRDPELSLPDRAHVTMTVPFMRAYTELLVRTCHRRGAHAIGGVSTFVPIGGERTLRDRVIDAVRAEKERESHDGFDGTRVAPVSLVPIARAAFGSVLGDAAHQKNHGREDVRVGAYDLLALGDTDGRVTGVGMELNVSVALQYFTAWLRGRGSVTIHNLIEDTSTAEICRTQLWQWVRHRVRLADGTRATPERYREIREAEMRRLAPRLGDEDGRLTAAGKWLDRLVLNDGCPPFITSTVTT